MAQSKTPANLGSGLRQLVERYKAMSKTQPGVSLAPRDLAAGITRPAAIASESRLFVDTQKRVQVNVYLDGSIDHNTVKAQMQTLGSSLSDENTVYRQGVISAYVPLDSVEALARTAGVRSVTLAYRPITNVGLVTSQGAVIHRTDLANQQGFTGVNITLGILSDSYNDSTLTTDRASDDVLSGDLPNDFSVPGGPGLKFLIEDNSPNTDTDEGRGMAQIIHDLAPDASLCFATAFISEPSFANNIRTLRTNPQCNADVIVDDVIYFDEPMFSDGQVAQAVDDVAFSPTLPGKHVAYFSSAGNQAKSGYSANLQFVSDSLARHLGGQGVNLNTIPSTIDTSGGFHNFDATNKTIQLAQQVTVGPFPVFSVQWDDPFDLNPSGITTDINVLFFDPATGNFLFAADDDNFATNQPIELFQVNNQNPAAFNIVFARTGKGAHLSQRIRYVVFGSIAGQFITAQTPTTFGHNAAKGANSVAAYVYDTDPGFGGFTPLYEGFSSPGPVTIAFDAEGNRLARAELRLKPDIAGADGVNTTFFPPFPNQDYEAFFGVRDRFPNFFGTSAAAPHAASVAALLLQKAGGPASLRPQFVHDLLQKTAQPRDVDFFFSHAFAGNGKAAVLVQARGENIAASGRNPNFFTVKFSSAMKGDQLQSLTIDLSATGLSFDPTSFPFTVGDSSPGISIVSVTPNTVSHTLTVTFSGFTSGSFLNFGIDRDFTVGGVPIEQGGSSADELAGATLSATALKAGVVNGKFVNLVGRTFTIYDGFGLVDAVNALHRVHDHDGNE